MGKNKSSEPEVGWVFWSVTFAVLVVPCIYAIWQITEDQTPFLARLGGGAIGAAVGAGILAWVVNSVVQHRAKKHRTAARKKAKKRKQRG